MAARVKRPRDEAGARARTAPKHAAPQPVQAPDGWNAVELDEVRAELDAAALELRTEIDVAQAAADTARRSRSGEGSGDEADAGTDTFAREHEMSLANNSRGLLEQLERALHRIDNGTYGGCEHCAEAIPKARLQAFPRATLCVACKQREERR